MQSVLPSNFLGANGVLHLNQFLDSTRNQPIMARQISDERKAAYYIGMGLQILGGLLFASTFVTFLTGFGDFTNFEANAKSSGFRAFGGMALMIVGNMVRGIGVRG